MGFLIWKEPLFFSKSEIWQPRNLLQWQPFALNTNGFSQCFQFLKQEKKPKHIYMKHQWIIETNAYDCCIWSFGPVWRNIMNLQAFWFGPQFPYEHCIHQWTHLISHIIWINVILIHSLRQKKCLVSMDHIFKKQEVLNMVLDSHIEYYSSRCFRRMIFNIPGTFCPSCRIWE